MPVVHCAVTRKVKPGFEDLYEEKLFRFVHETISADGVVGVHILRPPPGSDCREYGVLRSFENEEAAENFYSSAKFQEWLDDVELLVDGSPVHRRLTGLEAFFRTDRGPMPTRWKMAIVTFLGVLPSVLLWSNVLGPLISNQHWFLRAVIVNAAVVATLAWIVMPMLTKLFHPWLLGQTAHREEVARTAKTNSTLNK